MLFNSLDFIAFAFLFFAIYSPQRSVRGRLWWLLAASFFFYGFWDWRYCFLLAGSGLIDFLAALGIHRYPHHKGKFLGLSIGGNLASLGTFKYLGFFASNLNYALEPLGLSVDASAVSLTLPIGISFYTFQSMSYTIDVYRGELAPTRSPLRFFAYLAMFPQLVAGPIVRARELLPQMGRFHRLTDAERFEGWSLIAIGFFRKCVIADNLAPAVQAAYGNASAHSSGLYWWLATMMFAFQIYCDFSGYSAIARGLGRLMGFEFPENFRNPYISTSFREFWGRWHITLSTWFRDYVYIPLGGNRTGRAHINLWITMVISGLWHGAAWTFVIWGAIHALFLSVERITRFPQGVKAALGPVARPLLVLLIFALTLISWVFFRAESLADALAILGHMFSPSDLAGGISLPISALSYLAIAVAFEAMAYLLEYHQALVKPHGWRPLAPLALAALFTASIFLRGPGSAFIYFQF